MNINNYYYLRNFANNKYMYFEDDFYTEVDRTAFAEKIGSYTAAKEAKARFIKDFPHIEIVNEAGSLA